MKLNAWVSFTLFLLKTINVLVTEWSIVITFKYVQNLYLIVLSHQHCDRLKKVWKLVMCTILYHSRYFNESQYVIIQIIDTDGWTFFLRLSQTKHHHRRGKSRDDDDEFETLFFTSSCSSVPFFHENFLHYLWWTTHRQNVTVCWEMKENLDKFKWKIKLIIHSRAFLVVVSFFA